MTWRPRPPEGLPFVAETPKIEQFFRTFDEARMYVLSRSRDPNFILLGYSGALKDTGYVRTDVFPLQPMMHARYYENRENNHIFDEDEVEVHCLKCGADARRAILNRCPTQVFDP